MKSKFITFIVSALILAQIYVRDIPPPSFIEFLSQIGGVFIGAVILYIPIIFILKRKRPELAENKLLITNCVLILYLLVTVIIWLV